MEASRAAELAARQSYGKLVAWLTACTGDLAAAEDALSDAFLAALAHWPSEGVPASPEAWLLVAARRRWLDGSRRSRTLERILPLLATELAPTEAEAMTVPDDRLRLLFLCTHPAIERSIQAPLMLQAVLGLTAAQIGAAFLVAPATMGQRLVRAKARIRDAGIPFVLPPEQELANRSSAVLEAIYAAYGCGWEDGSQTAAAGEDLSEAAIGLARLCVTLLREDPEVEGLLALLLHCQARRRARRDAAGAYVPLQEQDTRLWSRPLQLEAETLLRQAGKRQRIGRFQLEAAIQSVHAQRAAIGRVDWPALIRLYDGLIRLAPSVGAQVSQVAAIAEVLGAKEGLARLDGIASRAALETYQPWWALRGHLLARAERPAEAAIAFGRALALTTDPAVATFLRRQSMAR